MQLIQPDHEPINPGYYQLAYFSLLKEKMSEPDKAEMIAKAQAANMEREVTGVLMIDDTLVVQWIEGRRSVVRELWAKILKDPRHHCIVELMHRDFQETRLYPDWAMHPTTRAELIETVHGARYLAQSPIGLPNPWAGAISKLCELVDPAFAQAQSSETHDNTLRQDQSAH
jgi:Sensors of blue-light using FAD